MISIQSFMLIALGFLIAALIGLLIVPAYRRRTERLAVDRLKRAMPLTEAEIRADKDRLRADYALTIHELEYQLEKATLASARQRVDINRRDAVISGLEGEVERFRTSQDEYENARRVLEQTIMDRLPKVEQRLAEARKLLVQRDREISALTQTTQKQARSLEDATHLNSQSRDEVHRLTAALNVRSLRGRMGLGMRKPADVDDEVALRTELEALKEKTRDQAAQITRLEGLLARAGNAMGAGSDEGADMTPVKVRRAEEEISRLRNELEEADTALRSAKSSASAGKQERARFEDEIRALKTKSEDQAGEISRLRAGLAVYQEAEKEHKSLAQSKVAMQARIATLEAQTVDQEQKIQALKSEIAAANERTALQAAHYTEEMRSLGAARSASGSGDSRRKGDASSSSTSEPASRRSLSDRIGGLSVSPDRNSDAGGEGSSKGSGDMSRASGFLRALGGNLPRQPAEVSITRNNGSAEDHRQDDDGGAKSGAASAEAPDTSPQEEDSGGDRPRGGLLERITRLDRAD